MKVICEYCGSYVEADENMKCPLCGAELGSAVKAEQERIQQQEEATRQYETETAAQEAKEGHVSEIINGVASIATAFVAGKTATEASSPSVNHENRAVPPRRPDGHRPPSDRPFPAAPGHKAHANREGMSDGAMFEQEGHPRRTSAQIAGFSTNDRQRTDQSRPNRPGKPGGFNGPAGNHNGTRSRH